MCSNYRWFELTTAAGQDDCLDAVLGAGSQDVFGAPTDSLDKFESSEKKIYQSFYVIKSSFESLTLALRGKQRRRRRQSP